MKPTIVAAALASCASLAMAGALAVEIPNYSCVKPIVPSKQASELVMQRFNKGATVYGKCVTQYVSDLRNAANANADPNEAKRASDAAETAIAEFNAFTAEAYARQGDDDPQSLQPVTNRRLSSIPPEPVGAPRR